MYGPRLSLAVDLDIARVVLGLGFLAVAAAMDWRRRVVKDAVWIAMGAVSLGLGQLDILQAGLPPYLHLMGLATGILYFGVFFGKPIWDEDGIHLRPPRLALYILVPLIVFLVWRRSEYDPAGLDAFYKLLTMPAMIVVAHGMYEFGLLRGGADAKAVMALALLFPGIYPSVGPLPLLRPVPAAAPLLAVVFPFAFIVLVNSALLFLAVPPAFLARNLAAGDAKLPRALFGYRAPLDRVPKYAWLIDRIEDGSPSTRTSRAARRTGRNSFGSCGSTGTNRCGSRRSSRS